MVIETQIGLILLLCQSYITKVVSQVYYFHKDFEVLCGISLSATGTGKQELISNYGPRIEGSDYTTVEVINALANYFKHHEEWGTNWFSLTGNAKRTAEIVSQIGADLGVALWKSRNLSKCVERLGVKSMQDLIRLPGIVDDWKRSIGLAYAKDLELDLQD